MNQMQYAGFVVNAPTLERVRQENNLDFFLKSFLIEKIVVLSDEGCEKLSKRLSPNYPFLAENRGVMYAAPNGSFYCLLVRTENEKDGILFALQGSDLYTAYVKDISTLQIDPVTPVEHTGLENAAALQTSAVFYHKPQKAEDVMGAAHAFCVGERRTEFVVEKAVVLSDAEYEHFKETDFAGEQIFLFDNQDRMWFDPAMMVWHCLLIKGETSKDGILVEAEGYSYARYAAYVPDCTKVQLKDILVQYEYPAKPLKEKASRRRNRGQDR